MASFLMTKSCSPWNTTHSLFTPRCVVAFRLHQSGYNQKGITTW